MLRTFVMFVKIRRIGAIVAASKNVRVCAPNSTSRASSNRCRGAFVILWMSASSPDDIEESAKARLCTDEYVFDGDVQRR